MTLFFQETIALMARLYHRTDPVKLFPVTIWIPFLDTNKMVYFIIVYLIELYLIVLIVASSYHFVKVGMTFSIAVTAQVEMLSKYVKMVGTEHRDQAGRLIYFMDVVDGGCRLAINNRGHQSAGTSANASLKAQPVESVDRNDAMLYEAYFMRLILMRHQELLVFINKVCIMV
uniref:Uncharacterized protein n=1 Tax=Cacopsylla melanoneura TaxID=428564 RepID=A0A8D8ZB37_9HEMI